MKPYESPWMDDDLRMLREAISRFVETRDAAEGAAAGAPQHHVDRETWRTAGEAGFLLMDVPAEYGGGGGDFRHEARAVRGDWPGAAFPASARACTASRRTTCSITAPRSRSSAGCRAWRAAS